MKYTKILEVSEDVERVYFTFFSKSKEQIIIAIPKVNSNSKTIFAGQKIENLYEVNPINAKLMLSELMKNAISLHPFSQLCNQETLMLIK